MDRVISTGTTYYDVVIHSVWEGARDLGLAGALPVKTSSPKVTVRNIVPKRLIR